MQWQWHRNVQCCVDPISPKIFFINASWGGYYLYCGCTTPVGKHIQLCSACSLMMKGILPTNDNLIGDFYTCRDSDKFRDTYNKFTGDLLFFCLHSICKKVSNFAQGKSTYFVIHFLLKCCLFKVVTWFIKKWVI